ncbi:MAG: 50S ribosomal protein L17 [Tannerella sp.]|jgi:large subunit ribosomal protein L17|nr:50S ribosomal protein L17 [Tannerella sp.]
MRHNKKINHLGRTHSHRIAMLSNMAVSLIMHKRIFTTTAKAKALRKYVEPLITKSKASSKSPEDVMHQRRIVFASLQSKYAVKELFQTVAEKVGDRPGGYTRIIRTGNRLGDNASMCFIELVDFNENMLKETKKATKTRRSRRGGKKAAETDTTITSTATAVAPTEKKTADTPVATPDAIDEAVTIEETEAKDEALVADAVEIVAEEEDAQVETPVTEEEKKDAE